MHLCMYTRRHAQGESIRTHARTDARTQTHTHTHTHIHTERHAERERERETGRQTDRQTRKAYFIDDSITLNTETRIENDKSAKI